MRLQSILVICTKRTGSETETEDTQGVLLGGAENYCLEDGDSLGWGKKLFKVTGGLTPWCEEP